MKLFLIGFTAIVFISKASFAEPDFSRVQYQCSKNSVFRGGFKSFDEGDPKYMEHLKIFFEKVIAHGIGKLEKINSKLAEKALKALSEKKLRVSCQPARGTPVAMFRNFRNKIFLGSAAWEVFAFSKQKGDFTKNLEGLLDRSSAMTYHEGFNINALFHEFLHFAQFDNQTSKAHNDLETNGLSVSDDLVYSCADAVFPNDEHFKGESEHQVSMNTCKNFSN